MPRRDPVGVIRQPYRSGSGAKTELSLSAVLLGKSPKYKNFGLLPRTELLMNFILLRTLTSGTSPGTASRPITPLK